MKKPLTYISLFSSAGIGCYGFKLNGYDCIATNELLSKRLKIQAFNKKCKYESGYIDGDITKQEVKQKLFNELEFWKEKYKIKTPDVLIATPPCQGMSKNGRGKLLSLIRNGERPKLDPRNQLIVPTVDIAKKLSPEIIVFENVPEMKDTLIEYDNKLINIMIFFNN